MVRALTPGSWHPIAATTWTRGGSARAIDDAAIARFVAATWPLPAWAPATSVRHSLSPLLPPPSALTRLVGALHGRMVIANQTPVAALSRENAARVRGLVIAARDGLPPSPWPAAPRGGSAAWPADSSAAYASVLAHEWVRSYDPAAMIARAARHGQPSVAVALYQGAPTVIISESGEVGGEHAADVRDEIARRLPPRMLAIPRVVATIEYRVTVVVQTAAAHATGSHAANSDASDRTRVLHDVVPAALAAGRALGDARRGAIWFAGSILVPDPSVVAAMDVASRQRWASVTGRAGARDRYWYPDSWARFLEPGRSPRFVTAAGVGRSTTAARRDAPYAPAVDRGSPVPPGYCLVDCVGALGIAVVVV